MSRTTNVCASVVAALVLAAVVAGPGPESAEAAVAWAAANDPEIIELVETHEDLDARLRTTLARAAYRSHLAGRVAVGDLAFADAAAEFVRLNRDVAGMSSLRRRFPGRSDEELAAWNVIEYVRSREMPAREKARVLARLDREFEARYGRPPCGPF